MKKLGGPPLFAGEDVPASLTPGHTLVGRYTVLDILGQGGMGVVSAAYDSRLDRRVALKLLRHSLRGGSEGEEARLVREAQAMARLSHPHVVAVYDAGTLEDGSFFIAMEYIQGRTLRQWRNERPRPWREVLEAYVSAGRGLAAAHAAGLIHRDFKADNVLVGEDGRVRVTDFGLARAQHAADSLPAEFADSVRQAGSWSQVLTLPGSFMGTPAYMAPELFQGRAADIRTDLFAFCASLYEALFGQLPFRGSSPTELTRFHLEGKAVVPPDSFEVPAWVTSTVLWGLDPDPQKRPASMEALLEALGNDPEVRRRMVRFRAGMALAMAGLAGLAAWGWVRQEPAAADCSQVQRQLNGIWDSEVRGKMERALLSTQLPYAPDSFARVAAMLDSYAQAWVKQRTEVCELIQQEGTQPQSLAVRREYCLERRRSQLRALTELLTRGPDRELLPRAVQVTHALPLLEYCADAETLAAAVPPPEEPTLRAKAEALQEQLDALEAQLEARRYNNESLARADQLLRQAEQVGFMPLRARAMLLAALVRDGTGDYKQAEELARQAAVVAAQGKDLAVAARASSLLYFLVGYREARPQDAALLEQGMQVTVELADDDLLRANALNDAGILLTMQGHYEEARQKYERALMFRQKVLGPDNLSTMFILNNLGNAMEEAGRYEDALRIHERVLAIREKELGPRHPDLANALGNLGNTLMSLGRYEQALEQHERALAIREQALGADHPVLASGLNNLGMTLNALGRYEEALKHGERALALQEQALGPDHPRIAAMLLGLGSVWEELGRYEEARRCYERALRIEEQALGKEHADLADSLSGLGRLLEATGRYEEARKKYERATALREKELGSEHVLVASSLNELGSVLTSLGRYQEAERTLARARALQEKALGLQHPEVAASLLGSGRLLLVQGRPAEAVPLLERALGLCLPRLRARIQFMLAQALWDEGRDRPRALALADEARRHWQTVGHPRFDEASRWLAARASP